MNLDEYNIDMATHNLRCRHAIGKNSFRYTMKCLILGRTKSRMIKVVVFGERYWKGKDNIKKVRYVAPWDIKERPNSNQLTK